MRQVTDIALFVKVGGAWRFEGFAVKGENLEEIRKTVELENGPGTFRSVQLEPNDDPAPELQQFVIWTRYVRPTGTIVRHAYGPYPTRAKAQAAMKKMVRESEHYYGTDLSRVETQVTNLIGDDHA